MEVNEMATNKYTGTQTEKNLQEAFAGESQARNKYTFFASVAKKEGYEQMSALFLKTADNEKEHAKMWFKELAGIGDTKENLAAAAEGENYEWTDMYEGFAKTAEEEIPILDKWISEKSGDDKYRYGKQQFKRRFDPSSVEEDLGDDPVKASEYGRRNLQYLLKHINDWVADKDKDFEFRSAVYDEVVYAYVRYLSFVLGDIGGIYLNERYDGDQRPSYKTVSKQQQKKALNFLLNELKDLSWLDARETLKEFPIRTSVAMQMEDGILSRCGAVAICSDKATSSPYTQKEYLADIERFVWAPTRAGRNLTETEMRLQMNYLTKLIEGSVAGVTKNASRRGIADMYAYIEVPEWLKSASRERFGIISEEFMGCFNNKPREMQAARLEEISGFDDDVDLKAPIEPMEHVYYGELKKVRSLVAANASTGSADTQRHYRLLLYKIDQALK